MHCTLQTFPGDFLGDEAARPLISPLVPMLALRAEYENGSQFFVKQIDWLMAQGWVGVRRTRGDGQFSSHPRHLDVAAALIFAPPSPRRLFLSM